MPRSPVFSDHAQMTWRIASLLFVLVAAGAARAAEDGDRLCYSREETRERIHAERLADPFAILRSTARAAGAEALGAKLCRTGGTLVYEINLLDRNGKVIHATVDAATGQRR